MPVVRLREKSEAIQLTPKETLEEIEKSSFRTDELIAILYDKKSNSYEFWQGGGISSEGILWHLKKFEHHILS